MIARIGVALLILINSIVCKKTSSDIIPEPQPASGQFAKGADVSWLTQMEAEGQKFYDSNGTEMDCMELLKKVSV